VTADPSPPARRRGKGRRGRSFWALFCLVVLAALAGLTSRKRAQDPQNPAAIAESACLQLKERIESPVAVSPESVSPASVASRTVASRAAGIDSSGTPHARAEIVPPRPLRNLFAPGPRIDLRPASAAPPRPRTPSPPKLSGIFIDGGVRQAAFGGRLAGQGESVDGYVLVEIGRDYVVLERNGTRQTVGLGRKP